MTSSLKHSLAKPFTSRQTAAILRLYLQRRLTVTATAKRLRLSPHKVGTFLRQRGVARRRGTPGVSRKLVPAIREKLKRELPTTQSSILARRYGVSKERIRQIREEYGAPSGREVQRICSVKARQQR